MNEPDPTRKDLARILRQGEDEILRLRRENELLAAQVRVVEIFGWALAPKGGGYAASEDVAWLIERLAKHFDKPEIVE